jgi:hypothetical protein
MVVENVRGAQPWVGKAKANFGSFYLWGDVGMVGKRVVAGVPRFGVSVQPMKGRNPAFDSMEVAEVSRRPALRPLCTGKTLTRGQGLVSRAKEPKTFLFIVAISFLAGIVFLSQK